MQFSPIHGKKTSTSLPIYGVVSQAALRKSLVAMLSLAVKVINYLWVDTCCIHKTSSAALIESINYMYRRYEMLEVSYAYSADFALQDVWKSLQNSRWFTRGWSSTSKDS